MFIHFSVNGNPKPHKRVEKTEEEWRTILTPEQFQISRLHGTERPHTGSLCSIFEGGMYQCICCNTTYLILLLSLIQVLDGQALRSLLKKMLYSI